MYLQIIYLRLFFLEFWQRGSENKAGLNGNV